MLLRPARDLVSVPIDWLWPGYLAVGSLAILDGDPGLGKSLLTLDLTARLTAGRAWPDGSASSGPASVVLLCEEDSESVVVARLRSMGADLARTFPWPRLDNLAEGLPQLPGEIDRLDQALEETGARLLIIDPIMAFLDRNVDVNTDANARRALRPLANLAEKRRCAILLVRHLNKHEGAQALYRGGGSIAFVAACRLAWLAGRDPKSEDRFILAQAKNNYAPKQPSLAYALPRDAPRVDWQGASEALADDLTARRRPSPRRQNAKSFLRAFLGAGPRRSHEVWTAAESQGHSVKTMKAAKEELAIRSQLIPGQGASATYWLLPGQEMPAAVSKTPELDALFRQLEEQWPPRSPLDDEQNHPAA
jgi:RecA-family ATPase